MTREQLAADLWRMTDCRYYFETYQTNGDKYRSDAAFREGQDIKNAILSEFDRIQKSNVWRPISEAPRDEKVSIIGIDEVGSVSSIYWDAAQNVWWTYSSDLFSPVGWIPMPINLEEEE